MGKIRSMAALPKRAASAAKAWARATSRHWMAGRIAGDKDAEDTAAVFVSGPAYLQSQMDIRQSSRWFKQPFVSETGGLFPPGDTTERHLVNLIETNDCVRRDMITLLLRSVIERKVSGDIAELGVYRGSTARLLHHYAPDRVLHLFDTFEGFSDADIKGEQSRGSFTSLTATGMSQEKERQVLSVQFRDTSVDGVLRYISPRNDSIRVHKGYFPQSAPRELDKTQFCFVHLDADLFEPTYAGLTYFYPKVPRGGIILVHDFNAWPGSRKAVIEFFADKLEIPVPLPDKSGSAVVVRLS